jgi:hypothetical protein
LKYKKLIYQDVTPYVVGIEIIDRCLLKGKYESKDMLAYLKQPPESDVFMSKGGLPYTERAGGRKLADDMIANLEEE